MTQPDNVRDTDGSPADTNRVLEEMYDKLAAGGGGTPVVDPAIYGPSSAKRAWQRALAGCKFQLERLVLLGDSWAAPVGASRPDRGWASRVAEELGHGSSGSYISPRAPQSVQLQGQADYDENANPHLVHLQNDGTSSFFALEEYDTIDLIYMRAGDAGARAADAPRWSANDGAISSAYQADIEILGGDTTYRLARIDWQPGTGKLTVHASDTASQGSQFFGIIARKGPLGRGLEVINWAREGYTAQNWVDRLGIWNIVEPFRALPATAGLIVSLGANDAKQGIPIAQVITNVRNLVGAYLDAIARVPVAFVLLPNPDLTPALNADWDQRMEAMISLAEELDAVVIDLRIEMGKQSEISPQLTPIDDYHLNDRGQERMHEIVVRAIH